METNKATILREETISTLVLQLNGQDFKIVLTDDNPNNVKSVFNSLLKELKNGLFKFTLEDDKDDLYTHISTEYLLQLNSELSSVYDELVDLSLVNVIEESSDMNEETPEENKEEYQ